MNLKLPLSSFLILILTLNALGQPLDVKINNTNFSLVIEQLDTLDGAEVEVVHLYRDNKKLLSHVLFEEEGDCSSLSIQLGSYTIQGDDIIFYSYWATCDRMPGALLKYGFRKQVYAVSKAGLLIKKETIIYIEDYAESEHENFYEGNGWKHKGLQYLYQTPQNRFEQGYLNDYIQCIEKKYDAVFVSNIKKKYLEREVRAALKKEIQQHTQDWVEGEIYGRVKK